MHWRQDQGRDRHFRQAKQRGYRARSAFKLLEICEKYRLVRPGQAVLDLGAAPGSWSQVAAERVGAVGTVVAIDLQPIAPLAGVKTLQGDVREVEPILEALGRPADVVLSDLAPKASGIRLVDQARAIELAHLALDVASRALRPGGALVVKVFRGEDFDGFLKATRARFPKVNVVIPEATRGESREAYVVARGFESRRQ